jgi:hypothetical protein
MIFLALIGTASAFTFWQDPLFTSMNNTIKNVSYNGYDKGVNQTQYQAYYKSNIGWGDAIMYCRQGTCFTIQPTKLTYRNNLGSNDDVHSSPNASSTGTANKNVMAWNNIFGNSNLTYTYEYDTLKENLQISKLRSPVAYLGNNASQITLDLDTYIKYPVGIDMYVNGSRKTSGFTTSEEIQFRNATNNTIYMLPKPTITDANGTSILGTYQVVFDGTYKANQQRTIYFYTKTPYAWLNSTERTYPVTIDPTVKFTIRTANSIATAVLSQDSFVVAYCDDTNSDVSFQVFNTSGAVILAETDADTTAGSCDHTSVSASAFNSNEFVIGWYDATDYDASFSVYWKNGTAQTGIIDADTSVSTSYSVSVSAFNSDEFVIGWYDRADGDASFSIYWKNGSNQTGIIDANTEFIGGSAYSVSVSAFDSDEFVIGWYDYADYDASFSVYWKNGSNQTGIIDADTDVGTSYSVSVSAFNSDEFVIGWFDNTDDDASFSVWWKNGSNQTGIIDADTAVSTSYSVSVSAFNNSGFAMGYFDYADTDTSVATYYKNTTNIAGFNGSWDVDTSSLEWQSVAAYSTATNISFCGGDKLVIAWADSSTAGNWSTYYTNGTSWNGTCPVTAVPPVISFTLFYPIACSYPNGCESPGCNNCTRAFFNLTANAVNVSPEGQNDTISFLDFYNTGTVSLNWTMFLNETSALYNVAYDTDSGSVGSKNLTTATLEVASVASLAHGYAWLWTNTTATMISDSKGVLMNASGEGG